MEILQPSWRGRSINTRKDVNGKKYTAMIGPKSLLYIPVNVLPNTVYRITLELYKENGNGILYCNLYGNRSYDFNHSKVECINDKWATYDVDVLTRDFPKTVPIVFRMWRGKEGTGTISVRRIIVSLLDPKGIELKTIGQITSIKEPGHKSPNPIEEKPVPPPPSMARRRAAARRERRKKLANDRRALKHAPNVSPIDPPKIPNPPPKVLPIIVGADGIKVSVVISIFNRSDFFDRTLSTYSKQTFPKEEFEIIVVDDNSTEDILKVCKHYNEKHGLQFQYIKINKEKGAIFPLGFTPALSNNIGFKLARGSVVVITGPESLQAENNIQSSWNSANEGKCIYGDIFRSSRSFVNRLKKMDWRNMTFSDIESINGAKADSSVTKGWWWYYVAVRKEHLLEINGVNEEFMRGMTGEDDDFAIRMSYSGVPLCRNHEIIGIHQDHSVEDKNDLHCIRYNKKKWHSLRNYSSTLLRSWARNKDPITNKNIEWGKLDAIIVREIL
jgi:glycosyltransferase involved in cell wall biosynthesis